MKVEEFKEILKKDTIDAMKSKNSIKLSTLRSIVTAITNAEKSGKKFNHIDILSMLAKQRQQSIEQYKKGNNETAANQEAEELEYIQEYLPKQISETELTEIITNFLNSIDGTKTMKDIGKVMNHIKTNYPGQDMKLVSTITKNNINGLH